MDRRRTDLGPLSFPDRRPHARRTAPRKTFLLQFHQPLVYILLVAGLVSGLLDEWVDAGVIWAVVLANAFVGFLQESQATKAIDALARAMKTEATVVRDGEKRRIQAAGLVPGDVVMLASGDQVPADVRLIGVRDLRVAEAALTGESVPVEKDANSVPLDTPLADRRSLAFASSLVTFGTATGVVVETGDRTEVGRISELIQSVTEVVTPLTREIKRFSQWRDSTPFPSSRNFNIWPRSTIRGRWTSVSSI
jgi:cation-transporting P-type ATPase F